MTVPCRGVEQLGEGELQEWERSGLIDRIGHDPRRQAGFETDARSVQRTDDRLGQLVGAERSHAERRADGERTECRVAQRSVEPVGADRRHDAHHLAPPRHLGERGSEGETSGLVGQRPQLLELVDHQDEPIVLREREERVHEPVVGRQRLTSHECGVFQRVDLPQGRGQRGPRTVAGRHRHDEPTVGAYRRDEPGEDQRALATSRRTDDDGERLGLHLLRQGADGAGAPEEVVGVGLGEGPQALERIGRHRGPRRRPRCDATTPSGTVG